MKNSNHIVPSTTELIESYLATRGFDPKKSLRTRPPSGVTYLFRSEEGTSVTLRLYTIEPEPPYPASPWIWFEFGVGTFSGDDGAVLADSCRFLYHIPWPVRPAIVELGELLLLVLLIRSPDGAFTRASIPDLIDLAVAVADELRFRLQLQAVPIK